MRITVAEQATEIDGQFTWAPPKTEAGRRTVTLPAVTAAALVEHLGRITRRIRRPGGSGPMAPRRPDPPPPAPRGAEEGAGSDGVAGIRKTPSGRYKVGGGWTTPARAASARF